MGVQYRCKNERRRIAVRDTRGPDNKPILNGIDYLEVSPDQKTLTVHFIHNLPGQEKAVPPSPAPAVNKENLVIVGGVRIQDMRVESARSSGNVLTLTVNAPGDFSAYTLRLITSPANPAPPPGFDPQLAEIAFSFKVDCPSEFDCKSVAACPPARPPEPVIDYLARDYASFRRLMLDRLAVVMPDWQERNPADPGIALVEVLAYAADHLSYYQDAVATEAYLGTARRRVSVRRHARLLDYFMHDGANARAWVCFEVTNDLTLPTGIPLLTQVNAPRGALHPDRLEVALNEGVQVFETLHELTLRAAHNEMSFYTWSDEQCCLPTGATQATLKNEANRLQHLAPGDVLVFEERLGPATGLAADADPAHRHAVRLTRVSSIHDPLDASSVVEIAWHAGDALPFPLSLSTLVADEGGTRVITDVSVARGNVVLADHGLTIADAALIPEAAPDQGRYRPRLQAIGITHSVAYDHDLVRTQAAAAAMVQDPRTALPAVKLHENGEAWTARRDLLSSDRFAREFVVETEEDGSAYLRFGDGVLGRRPAGGARLRATYRVGNGRAGNVGAEAIAHVLTPQDGIAGVRNPLPAQGGIDPEPIAQVRRAAPQAFRIQERAVTEADYAAATQRHPEVQKAVASRRWTGSWHTMFVTVDRKGGRLVDVAFKDELRAFLERFRLAGHGLEVEAPRFVPLDIALIVCVAPGYFRGNVKAALLETFSTVDLPDGRRGFFHLDNFTFGQPVFLSQIVAAAMRLSGVAWVQPVRFQRLGQAARGELAAGRITLGRLEIARLDHDPNVPENGKIEFHMEGGL